MMVQKSDLKQTDSYDYIIKGLLVADQLTLLALIMKLNILCEH